MVSLNTPQLLPSTHDRSAAQESWSNGYRVGVPGGAVPSSPGDGERTVPGSWGDGRRCPWPKSCPSRTPRSGWHAGYARGSRLLTGRAWRGP